MGCQVAAIKDFSCIDENTGLQQITGADSVEDGFSLSSDIAQRQYLSEHRQDEETLVWRETSSY
jgi:hypothetical protein